MTPGHALIVGGGIAGLGAARALGARGWHVTLIEQSSAWAPVGAGIVLARNALRVLDHLGAGTAVRRSGRLLPAASIHNAEGALLLGAGASASLVAVHRADLHAALLEGVGADVHLGTTVTALRPGRRVEVELSDGRSLELDLVVGADGIRSRTRALLLGPDAPAVAQAGYRAARIVTDDRVGLGRAVEQWGRGRRVGLVPLADHRLYAFLVDDCADPTSEDAGVAGLIDDFSGFGGPAGRFLAGLDSAATVLRHPIEELSGSSFGQGRVVLIGDAAHAMTPNLGQGAAQALEDVPALVRALEADGGDVAGGLAGLRLRRVARVKRQSAMAGRVGQAAGRVTAGARDLLLRAIPPRLAAGPIDAVTGHDPLRV